MVPRVMPGLGKTKVLCRELRKRPLPVRLDVLDGSSFEVAGAGAYMQCEDNI